MGFLISTLFSAVSVVIASTIHEFAHAFTAHKLGDITPKANGRLTLNPLSHIDPVGALSLLIFRFGWSKPVPINSYNFKNPKLGMALTALAGPLSNVLLAFITGKVFHIVVPLVAEFIPETTTITLALLLYNFVYINCALAVFNLIPIPPLDGSNIISPIIPYELREIWEKMEQYGIVILLILILPLSPFSSVTNKLLAKVISGLVNFIIF